MRFSLKSLPNHFMVLFGFYDPVLSWMGQDSPGDTTTVVKQWKIHTVLLQEKPWSDPVCLQRRQT